MMTTPLTSVGETGEFKLIDRIREILPDTKNPSLILGIGDDTAVIKKNDKRATLLTCDIQIEGQHFDLNFIDPYSLGRRAMSVNLSDIAAMGGTPTFALVSLGIPENYPVKSFDQLIQGMSDQISNFGAAIIGGNMSRSSNQLIIDITMVGECQKSGILFRNGAKENDLIFVTGKPGRSSAGFHILKMFGKKYPAEYSQIVDAHLNPVPRVEIGQALNESGIVTAMIDISDGIGGDLNHICQQSQVGAEIQSWLLPLISEKTDFDKISSKSITDLALFGGEDYELLFTVKPNTELEIIKKLGKKFNTEFTNIGRITHQKNGLKIIDEAGRLTTLDPKSWDHFSTKND